MTPAEKDALETAEHLQRHSFEAKANRRIAEMEEYLEGRKNTAHVREIADIISNGIRAVQAPKPSREEACFEWHHEIDLNLDSYGATTKRFLMRIFDLS